MIPRCPNCGARWWRVPSAVELDVIIREDRIEAVGAASSVMHGEGDPVCVQCGEQLLDWSSRREDDEAWNSYHDERRAAWDELHETVRGLSLPSLDRWSIVSEVVS